MWIPAIVVPGSFLLARHVLTLPKPSVVDPVLIDTLHQLRLQGDRDSWTALHVLYSACGCSQRVLAKLLLRGPIRHVKETIVYIGPDDAHVEKRARALGYQFDLVTQEQLLARYHLEAAPLMVVADSADTIRYVGGYTDRKQGETVRDAEILSRLLEGRAVEALPTFGCAVSKKLQASVDPLGLR